MAGLPMRASISDARMAAAYAILAGRTKMTYPADCQARSATVEALEGHLRSTPAISEPQGEAGAAAYEPLKQLEILFQ